MQPNDYSFRKYKAYADIRGGSPGWGRQMTVGSSTTAIFGDLGGYIFGNVRDKASSITWRYATPCRPIIDSKVNDLEWPWVPIFHVKIRFCRARLSRSYLSVIARLSSSLLYVLIAKYITTLQHWVLSLTIQYPWLKEGYFLGLGLKNGRLLTMHIHGTGPTAQHLGLGVII